MRRRKRDKNDKVRDADLKLRTSIVAASETLELPLRDQGAHFRIDQWKIVGIRQQSEIRETQFGRNLEIFARCVAN